ncbi:Protein OS-9 [Mortierella sp. AM989]|nr:Protein OS-9 [Mortierella sp. AM989]
MHLTALSLSKASILAYATFISVSVLVPITASNYGFVYNDLLAYPQYHVQCLDELVSVSDIGAERLRQGNLHHQQAPVQMAPQIETVKLDQSQDQRRDQDQDQHNSNGQSTTPPSNAALDPSSRMVMTDADGQKWACTIPSVQIQVDKPEPEKTPEEMREEKRRSVKRGLELLDNLSGRCLLTRIDYWTYEYCHKKRIRQFNAHNVNGKWEPTSEAATHVLATYQPPPSEIQSEANTGDQSQSQASSSPSTQRVATTTELKVTNERKYLAQYWDYGDVCDLTGAYRKVEVQFQCANVDDRIQLVTEPATCTYIMIIYSSALCKDVAFELIPTPEANMIDCRRIVSDDHYKQQKAANHGAIEDGLGSIAFQGSGEQIKLDRQLHKDEVKPALGEMASQFKEMASLIDKVEAASRRERLDEFFTNFEAYLKKLKPFMSKAQLDALQEIEDLVEKNIQPNSQGTQPLELESILANLFGGESSSSKEVEKDKKGNKDVQTNVQDEEILSLASLLGILDTTKKTDGASGGDNEDSDKHEGQGKAKEKDEDVE